jgi:hypothetical protein
MAIAVINPAAALFNNYTQASSAADLENLAMRGAIGLGNKALENELTIGAQNEKLMNLMQTIQTGKMNNDWAQMKSIAEGYDD